MDKSDVINLVKYPYVTNEYGVRVKEETPISRQVFCHVDSVTQSEFFNGGATGLNPEYRITMFRFDYDDETILEYNGEYYSIYRTYIARNDEIELYVERRKGNAKS